MIMAVVLLFFFPEFFQFGKIVDVYNTIQGDTLTNEQFQAVVENVAKIRNSMI